MKMNLMLHYKNVIHIYFTVDSYIIVEHPVKYFIRTKLITDIRPSFSINIL